MTDPLFRVTGLSVDAFAASHWGTTPLLQRALQPSVSTFSDLLTLQGVDELVSRRGLRTPFLRMSIDGNLLPPSRFTRGGGAGAEISDQVADDKVLTEFAAGATIVLQGLHRMWPPIQTFANELSMQLGHPVQVNAYITPPQNRGFAPHYDVHDVFVLQFAGRKRWRIHEPVWTSPLRSQPWQDRKRAITARCDEAPLIESVLEDGDTLYLPRGFIHAATSLGDVSGHLTVGVHPLTRRTLADQIFAMLDDDEEIRRSLPLGVDLSDARVLDGELTATLAALRGALDRLDAHAIARGIGRHLAAQTRPAALRPLEQVAAAAALTAHDIVCLRPGLRVHVRIDGDDVCVESPDKMLRMPVTTFDAVRDLTSGRPIAAGDLSLAVDEGIAVIATFLREGIVVPA